MFDWNFRFNIHLCVVLWRNLLSTLILCFPICNPSYELLKDKSEQTCYVCRTNTFDNISLFVTSRPWAPVFTVSDTRWVHRSCQPPTLLYNCQAWDVFCQCFASDHLGTFWSPSFSCLIYGGEWWRFTEPSWVAFSGTYSWPVLLRNSRNTPKMCRTLFSSCQ